jgi:predicted dehydrogenase
MSSGPDPIRVAFFGNGFSRTTMLPCLRHVEGIRLVGLASPNLERARATGLEFEIEQVASDHREILERTRPDLVFVVTPPHRHLEMSDDALTAGCHVICEKPTAMNQEESARLLAAARRAPDRLTLIDHELRMDPRRRALRDLVAEGRLGDIMHATYTLFSSGRRDPTLPWTWWSDRDQGGGAWGAIGSHAVDGLRVYLGEVESARGRLEALIKHRVDPASGDLRAVTADDFAAAWLRFQSGATATITISSVEGERRHQLTLAGTRGAARIDEQAPLLVLGEDGPWREIEIADELPGSAALGIPDTDWARGFLRYAREIVGAIREGRTEVPGAATFEDGHRNQQVLDAVRRSAATEAWSRVGGAGRG